jgi:hypothetical protein
MKGRRKNGWGVEGVGVWRGWGERGRKNWEGGREEKRTSIRRREFETTKYVYIKSTTGYVLSSELGLSQPLSH